MTKRIFCIFLLPLILFSASCDSEEEPMKAEDTHISSHGDVFEEKPIKAEEPDLAFYEWLPTEPDAILYPTFSRKNGYNTMYGFVNQNWEIIYEPVFTIIENYYIDGKLQAYFASRGDGKTLVIDMQGRVIATLPALNVSQYVESPFVIITTPGEAYKQGLFDMQSLSILIPPKENQSIYYANCETVVVMVSETERYLYHIPTKAKRNLDHDIAYVQAGENINAPILAAKEAQEYKNIYNYIDTQGNYISQDWYRYAEPFMGEFAFVKYTDDGQYYFIDKNASKRKESYDSIEVHWESGLYIVKNSNGSAVLDLNLNAVFPMQNGVQFEILTNPHETFVLQKQEGKATKIYQTDGTFWGEFDTVFHPNSIYEILGEGIFSVYDTNDNITFVMDCKQGKNFLMPHDGYGLQLQQEKYVLVQTNEKVYVYSLKGEELYDTIYHRFQTPDYISVFLLGWQNIAATLGQSRSAVYWVQQGRYQGYIDQDGNWLYQESRYLLLND